MVNSLATTSAASQVSSSALIRRTTSCVVPSGRHTARSNSGVPGFGLAVPSI